MMEYYKKPSVKFVIDKDNFNRLLALLSFQEKNIVTESWREKAGKLKDLLLKYSIPHMDENGEIGIIDVALFQREGSELIVLLISMLSNIEIDKDYTQLMNRK